MIGLCFIISLSVVTAQSVPSPKCLPCSSDCISVQDPTHLLTGQWQLSEGQATQGACWDGGCQYSDSDGREKCICFVESGGKISHETCQDNATSTTATPILESCANDCCKSVTLSSTNPDTLKYQAQKLGKYIAIGCHLDFPLYKIDSEKEFYMFKVPQPQYDWGDAWYVDTHVGDGSGSTMYGFDTGDRCPDSVNPWIVDDSYGDALTVDCTT